MPFTYNFQTDDELIFQKWDLAKIGSSVLDSQKTSQKTWTVVMPPPNLTGNLHAGHALEHYLMDSLSRFERQNLENYQGKQVLYYPGIDHAGIQLEGVINKLVNQGEFDEFLKSKLGENFGIFTSQNKSDRANWLKKNYADIWLECAWSKVSLWRDNQKTQSMILGDSPDWDKQLFTLDDQAVKMVNYAFIKYWQDGIIYRDSYLINWSVALQTALSDVPEDIGREERVDPLVTFEYEALSFNFKNPSDKTKFSDLVEFFKPCDQWPRLRLSTVRIETKFTDLAVAMHPSKFPDYFNQKMLTQEIQGDLLEKFQEFLKAIQSDQIEVFYHLPALQSAPIKLIFSDKVDASFGTGIVKVTPGHDLFDYNLYSEFVQKGILENKPIQTCIGRDGKLTDICGEFAGLEVEKARPLILKRLLETGYIATKTQA